MGRPKIHTGARAIIKINDQVVIFALACQYDIMTDHKVINTVDNPLPEEIVPTNIDVRATVSVLRVPRESAAVLAYQPTILNSLHQGYVSIEIRDRGTDDTILFIPKALMSRRTGAIAARRLAAETWVFRGIGYWDERPPTAAKKVGTSQKNAVGDFPINRAVNQNPVETIQNATSKIKNSGFNFA